MLFLIRLFPTSCHHSCGKEVPLRQWITPLQAVRDGRRALVVQPQGRYDAYLQFSWCCNDEMVYSPNVFHCRDGVSLHRGNRLLCPNDLIDEMNEKFDRKSAESTKLMKIGRQVESNALNAMVNVSFRSSSSNGRNGQLAGACEAPSSTRVGGASFFKN